MLFTKGTTVSFKEGENTTATYMVTAVTVKRRVADGLVTGLVRLTGADGRHDPKWYGVHLLDVVD